MRRPVTISVPYHWGCGTIVLPALQVLLMLGLVPVVAFLIFGVGDLMALTGLMVLGTAVGIGCAAVTYPWVVKLTGGGRRQVQIDGPILRWGSGRRWRQIDLSKEYWAHIGGRPSDGTDELGSTGVGIVTPKVSAHLFFVGAGRERALTWFPFEPFIDDVPFLPTLGMERFVFEADEPEAMDFMAAAFESLWETRGNNLAFSPFEQYPWDTPPRPDAAHVVLLDRKKATAEQMGFLERIEGDVVAQPASGLSVTPDYLVYEAPPSRSIVFPLDSVRVEESADRSLDAHSQTVRLVGRDAEGDEIKVRIGFGAGRQATFAITAFRRFVAWARASQPSRG